MNTSNKVVQDVVIVAAMGTNRSIGKNNALPWRISADLKRFKALTLGCPMIMGRKTFESFGAKPLPGRHNIVVSRSAREKSKAPDKDTSSSENPRELTLSNETGLSWVQSLDEAFALCAAAPRVFVIGGAQVYAEVFATRSATRVELTRVSLSPDADTFFPAFEADFTLVQKEHQEEAGTEFVYETWERKGTL